MVNNDRELDMLAVIVAQDKGSKVLALAREVGVAGGTILHGIGTASITIFDYLGLNDKKKAIIKIVGGRDLIIKAAEHISDKMEFHKPNHGIAYIENVLSIYGSHFSNGEGEERGEGEIMYNAIYTIVERGVASDVIEAAEKAGSKGGTVINARGAGTHETQKVFNMVIEPEKEIVLIISEADKTGAIVDAIREKVKIEEPGNGILYVTDVRETYGMAK